MTRVILIGYMGVGKTTVGRELAKMLHLTFYDLDWYIESRMRRTIKELFDTRGEEGFRLIEHNLLHEVAEFENVVISCGGGTPCFFDNMDYLNGQGDTVYLRASTDVLLSHLRMGKGVRPLLVGLGDERKRAFIDEQLSLREPYYLKAKHVVDVLQMDNNDKISGYAALICELVAASK